MNRRRSWHAAVVAAGADLFEDLCAAAMLHAHGVRNTHRASAERSSAPEEQQQRTFAQHRFRVPSAYVAVCPMIQALQERKRTSDVAPRHGSGVFCAAPITKSPQLSDRHYPRRA